MPKYVVNKGAESEMEIFAASHKETNALAWFYDTQERPLVCLKQSFIETLDEHPA